MKKLLLLKHWHLFLLIFICGCWTSPSPLKEIINSVAVITFCCWIYAIGVTGHQKIIKDGLKPMNIKLFKFNVALTGLSILLLESLSSTIDGIRANPYSALSILFSIWLSYCLIAVLQMTIFACKIIAKSERKSEVMFTDYMFYLFQIGFFMFGIWFLQPRINRIFSDQAITS